MEKYIVQKTIHFKDPDIGCCEINEGSIINAEKIENGFLMIKNGLKYVLDNEYLMPFEPAVTIIKGNP